MPRGKGLFETEYGRFSPDGREFIVTRPDPPAPWINILSNTKGGYGVMLSQAGGGFSFMGHQTANRITRWTQDLARDYDGRYIYLLEKGCPPASLSWKPIQTQKGRFETVHGLGYTRYISRQRGLDTSWTIFVPVGEPIEVWNVTIRNRTSRRRRIRLVSFLEWALGLGNTDHREFDKSFFELGWEPSRSMLTATKRLWEIPSRRGNLNEDWPFVAFHASRPWATRFQTDKSEFLGSFGNRAFPAFGMTTKAEKSSGAVDASAALEVPITCPARGEARASFVVGVAPYLSMARILSRRFLDPRGSERAFLKLESFWRERLDGLSVETPDPSVDLLANTWLKYQVLASREYGKGSYYCQGGGTGAREIQDVLAISPLEPGKAEERLIENFSHQASDGTMPHFWDTVTGDLGRSAWSDDMLWTPYVLSEYLKETGNWGILERKVTSPDGPEMTVFEKCRASLERVLSKKGPGGLPLILEGDWNDGLSAVGLHGTGESVWLAHFLHGNLNEFSRIASRLGDRKLSRRWASAATRLRERINRIAWDGNWYRRARTDHKEWIGSRSNKEGRIFLNAQAWAITMGVVPPDRMKKILSALEKRIYTDNGPLLFSPPYHEIDPSIGYLTRYSPGVRENGGVYTHAANWAIQAEVMAGRGGKAWDLFRKISPVLRGMDPETYCSEPYVTAGNIESAPSPNEGRGGWTWYTSSGAWLFKILTEYLLGIRPDYDGLLVNPIMPPKWRGFTAIRRFRDAWYKITVKRSKRVRETTMTVDGAGIAGHLIPPLSPLKRHYVEVKVP